MQKKKRKIDVYISDMKICKSIKKHRRGNVKNSVMTKDIYRINKTEHAVHSYDAGKG